MQALQLPLFKRSNTWTAPKEFPDLTKHARIAIDCETKDPNLKEKGPGTLRGDGYVVGIAVATDKFKGYYPIRHRSGTNLDATKVVSWLKDQLITTSTPKVGANLLYDLEWLRTLGIVVNGPLYDVQVAEPLLDEESLSGYALEKLCKKYGFPGKDERELKEWASDFNLKNVKGDLWQLPPEAVGQYAEYDAAVCLSILDKQLAQIEAEKLQDIWKLECSLIPILLKMRMKGVRVDLDKAQQLSDQWKIEEKVLTKELDYIAGFHVNPWSSSDMKKVCSIKGIKHDGHFDKEFVKWQDHPFFKKLQQLRTINKMRRDFVESMVLENQVNGRIHTQFHPMKKDEEGTRSGRFSSTNPNLQQVPSRDENIAPLIRGLFIPEEGCKWAKMDYSQQEPRVLLHYAYTTKCTHANKIRERYLENPRTDWYKILQDGAGLTRKDSKDATLGRFYGMGNERFSKRYNKTLEEAERTLQAFDNLFPFVKELSWNCINLAAERGWIRTLLGRKRHFNKWACRKGYTTEGVQVNTGKVYNTKEEAMQDQPGAELTRAGVHKALNSLIQGSSGDMIKKAMIEIYDQTGEIMHLTVHDELDCSVQNEEHARRLQAIKETCVKLSVPIISDLSIGDTWGTAKKLL